MADNIVVPANNTVKLTSNNVLLVVETGHQTKESVLALNEKMAAEVDRLHKHGRPALVLADFSRVTGHDQGANNATISSLNVPYDAMAVYGADPLAMFMINLLSLLLRSHRRLRAFRNVKKATKWTARLVVAGQGQGKAAS